LQLPNLHTNIKYNDNDSVKINTKKSWILARRCKNLS